MAYVINASDLRALYALDKLNKYADDSYLIVPSINSQLVREELDHISTWASNNNLKLNVDKSKEMIIKRPRTRSAAPPPLLGIERVESMNILGVIFQCNLSFTMQVDRLVVRGAQTMYALGTLKHHELSGPPLWEVTRATFIARLTYASQAWWGLLDAQGRDRLEKVLNKAVREGFLPKRPPSFAQIRFAVIQRMSRCLVISSRTPSMSSIICYHQSVRQRVDSEPEPERCQLHTKIPLHGKRLLVACSC